MAKQKSCDSQFSDELRMKTKSAHDESDRLINLKLAVVLTDTKLWATAVAEFYFVFREIERCIDSHRDHSILAPFSIVVANALRTPAFEQDLEFYLGTNWRATLKPSSCSVDYCNRIAQVSEDNPILLIAYGS